MSDRNFFQKRTSTSSDSSAAKKGKTESSPKAPVASQESRFVECPFCKKQVSRFTISDHTAQHLRDKQMESSENLVSLDSDEDQVSAKGPPVVPGDSPSKPLTTTTSVASADTEPKFAIFGSNKAAAGEGKKRDSAPLAERMRPRNLDEVVGHKDVVGTGTLLRSLLDADRIPSMIFWGPPGCGKTTLAKIICKHTHNQFKQISAVTSGLPEIRELLKEAKEKKKLSRKSMVLFIDEIHRFNKLQQDVFLPYVEDGTIVMIGATTENPSFELNTALLSRSRVFVLHKLTAEEIVAVLRAAASDTDRGIGHLNITVTDEVLLVLATAADGDARVALNALEMAGNAAASEPDKAVSPKHVAAALQRSHLAYDKKGDQHFDIISALHKSVRGGNVDASLYWLARMLQGGEDPLYVARRVVRMAAEDIGLADPQALPLCVSAFQACHLIGMPECDCILAEAVAYLARAPKSVAVYKAYGAIKGVIGEEENPPVPLHLRNAPTRLMKDLGYGKEYQYPPDHQWKVEQEYLPDQFKGQKWFAPDWRE